jgi:hypothetical protein
VFQNEFLSDTETGMCGVMKFAINLLKSITKTRQEIVVWPAKVLLTYLCGTATNIWLRSVEEDPSMSACLEHSASNL